MSAVHDAPSILGHGIVIVETIVSTVNLDGVWNIAPMGPHLDDGWEADPTLLPSFTLRPYAGSSTHENLLSTRRAVIHFCSDLDLFARSAIESIRGDEAIGLTTQTKTTDRRLKRCERYFVVTCEVSDNRSPRPVLRCEIIEDAMVDPPRPLNRAAAAVIEASILATRWDRLDGAEIQRQFEILRDAVDKTAGVVSRHAFDRLCRFIEQKTGREPGL